MRDAPPGSEPRVKVGLVDMCKVSSVYTLYIFSLPEVGEAALIRNFNLLKPFIVSSIYPDIGIPTLGDFKALLFKKVFKKLSLISDNSWLGQVGLCAHLVCVCTAPECAEQGGQINCEGHLLNQTALKS